MQIEKETIQRMEIQDLDEVLEIENSVSLTPWSREIFYREIQNPLTHCYVIRNEESIPPSVVGYICFQNIQDESELHNISVHPFYQRSGLGKKLMQFYIDFCRREGIKISYLEVHSLNRSALHLYQSFSYQRFGMRKKFYQGKFDALLMMKII